MTNRQFYIEIINGKLTDEVIQFAKNQLDKMDKANEKRRAASKSKTEGDIVRTIILEKILGTEFKTSSEIAQILCNDSYEVSTYKVSGILRELLKEGLVYAEDVRIPKKGIQKAYRLV